MKKSFYTLLVFGLMAVIVVGCDSGNNRDDYDQHAAKNALDLSGRDTTANPATNFFRYANGTWLDRTEIPASKSGWGSFYVVRDKALHKMRTILDSVSTLDDVDDGSVEQQVRDLYKSAMDSMAIEKAGIKPLQADLKRIDGMSSKDEIMPEIAREYKNGGGALFSFYVAPDDKASMVERVHLNQGGLGLPNRNYYLKDNKKKIRDAYLDYVAKMLKLSGGDKGSADQQAQKVVDLETQLAKVSKTPVQLRDPQANYHLMTIDKLNQKTPNIDWASIADKMSVDVDTVQVGQPEFYSKVSELMDATPLPVWKDYLRFHMVNSSASWLSSDFADAHFDFYNKMLSGQEQQEPRWKRASSLINGTLGDALGKLYVERYFPPSAKKYMEGLVDNLHETYKEHIKNRDWMSDSTKTQAINKLDAIVKKIGYPDEWKDYSSIEIDSTSLVKNLQHIGRWKYQYNIDKLGKPTDRTEWGMTPPTVNAYYNPSFNEIVFPAGILQPPFYYQGADDAVNYGAIGAVIGHETTHGFDDQGSQYDKNGNLDLWWSKKDRKRFKELTQQVVDEYNNYTVLDTLHVNGKLTLGENIADIGGLAIAHAAFEKTDEAKSGKKINGLTPEQRFFMAFGQVWRIKNRPKHLRLRINNDPHSPEKYRVIGPLSNMKSFYKAFNVQPSDSLYRADSVRVHIW